jgi:hypothetical protein
MESLHTALALDLLVGLRARVRGRDVLGRFREHRPTLGRAAMHQHDVHGHAIQPSREARAVTKVTDAAMHLQEDLLHDVFEIRAPTEHALRESQHVFAVLAKQLAECLDVASLAALDEAQGFHTLDFNSARRCWLARRVVPPRGIGNLYRDGGWYDRNPAHGTGRGHRQGSVQPPV